MKNLWESIKVIVLIIIMLGGIAFIFSIIVGNAMKESYYYSTEPGICPTCGNQLIKGVYGRDIPKFCWYCPNCD